MEKPAEIVVMNGGTHDTGHLRPLSSVLGSRVPPSPLPRQISPACPLPGSAPEQPWPSVDMDMDIDPGLALDMDPTLSSTQQPQERDQGLALACCWASSSPSPQSPCLWLHKAQCLHFQEGEDWQDGVGVWGPGWAEAPVDTWLARVDSYSNFTEPVVSRISSKRAIPQSRVGGNLPS